MPLVCPSAPSSSLERTSWYCRTRPDCVVSGANPEPSPRPAKQSSRSPPVWRGRSVAMAGNRRAVKDPEGRKTWTLSKLDGGCQVCGTRNSDWRGFSTHHILGGNCGRSDEPANYLLCCSSCHDLCENRVTRDVRGMTIPTIPLGMALSLKLIRNHEDWNRERLRQLSGERLPELVPPHSWINVAYGVNCPNPYRPWCNEHIEIIDNINAWIDSYPILR